MRAAIWVADRECSTSLYDAGRTRRSISPFESVTTKVLDRNVCRRLNVALHAINSAISSSANKAESGFWPSIQVDWWVRINSSLNISSSSLPSDIGREQCGGDSCCDEKQDQEWQRPRITLKEPTTRLYRVRLLRRLAFTSLVYSRSTAGVLRAI
jgi:hypothetical protein